MSTQKLCKATPMCMARVLLISPLYKDDSGTHPSDNSEGSGGTTRGYPSFGKGEVRLNAVTD